MKFFFQWMALLCASAALAQPVSTASLPSFFQQSIPAELSGGLQLVEVKARCERCEPWRDLGFYSLNAPVRTERVTVLDGYRAMYAFPGTHYFANVKIERSEVAKYEADRDVMDRALRHECQRKQTNVENYLAENLAARDKFETRRMPGRPYVEVESGIRDGLAYLACTENVIGLISSTISQVQIFVPAKRLTITAYLLKQEKMHFKSIEEFRALRDGFLSSYIDFLNKSP